MVATNGHGPVLSTTDLPTNPTHPGFGDGWHQYLRTLAASEDHLLGQASAARRDLAVRERLVTEREALAYMQGLVSRDEHGKANFTSETYRKHAATLILADDEQHVRALAERDEAQSRLEALTLQVDSAKHARGDAYAFLAWATAFLQRCASREVRA